MQGGAPDVRRPFEVTWSVEPQVVRAASRIPWQLVVREAPELAPSAPARLVEPALPVGEQLRSLASVTNRMLSYVSEGRR